MWNAYSGHLDSKMMIAWLVALHYRHMCFNVCVRKRCNICPYGDIWHVHTDALIHVDLTPHAHFTTALRAIDAFAFKREWGSTKIPDGFRGVQFSLNNTRIRNQGCALCTQGLGLYTCRSNGCRESWLWSCNHQHRHVPSCSSGKLCYQQEYHRQVSAQNLKIWICL